MCLLLGWPFYTQITLLLAEKVTILSKYSDFAKVFSKKLVEVLPKRVGINEHTIKYK